MWAYNIFHTILSLFLVDVISLNINNIYHTQFWKQPKIFTVAGLVTTLLSYLNLGYIGAIKELFLLFLIKCMCVWRGICTWVQVPIETRDIRSLLNARITGSFEPPEVSAGSLIWFLCKRGECSSPLSHLFIPSTINFKFMHVKNILFLKLRWWKKTLRFSK